MTKKRKWLSTLLIVLGIGIASFPIADKLYTEYWQNRLLEAYDSSLELEIEAPELVESDYFALQAIYEQDGDIVPTDFSEGDPFVESTETTEGVTTSSTEATTEKPKTVDKSVIGKIKISKIDLTMPLLMGATERNLNRGAAVISGTSPIGEIGNIGIAGHRGRSYGVFFNRLNEIEVGDIIEVTANNKVFKYTVYETLIVEPTDVSVLYRNDEDKVLTLVTCEPVKNPTHRLIVHALQNP